MKKTLISIAVLSTVFSVANDNYVLIINEDDSNYNINNGSYRIVESEWVDTGELFNCNYETEQDEVYYDKSYSSDGICQQNQTRTTTTYFNPPFDEERVDSVSTEMQSINKNVTDQELTGSFTANSCKNVLSFDSTFQNKDGIYKISSSNENVDVYCDMTKEGGGWTLIGVIANDETDYWAFNSTAFYEPIEYGNLTNKTKDYQSKGWGTIQADQLMLGTNNLSKYAIYNDVLNNETLSSKYNNQWTNSQIYKVSKTHGSWWNSICDTFDSNGNNEMNMRTFSLDSDSPFDHKYASHSRGFVFMSKSNGSCDWDDTYGGFNKSSNTNSTTETNEHYPNGQFHVSNFSASNPLNIFVK